MTSPDELAAQRIAARGRDALLERLRPAFAKAAASQPGSTPLDPARLEALVQAAADRADGVMWRRALAGVGKDELGIWLAEAIDHPAVQRAQEILGVPAYEPVGPSPQAGVRAPEPQGTAAARATPGETAPVPTARPPAGAAPATIRMAAVHLGGIETVPVGTGDLELRFSGAGLDVVSMVDGETIGRLTWEDITDVELARPSRLLRPLGRRSPGILVRTDLGQAHFELPGLSEDQVRKHLASVVTQVRRGSSPA